MGSDMDIRILSGHIFHSLRVMGTISPSFPLKRYNNFDPTTLRHALGPSECSIRTLPLWLSLVTPSFRHPHIEWNKITLPVSFLCCGWTVNPNLWKRNDKLSPDLADV